MVFWLDLLCFTLAFGINQAIKSIVIVPAHRFRSAPPRAQTSASHDPLAPPSFSGEGNAREWARQVADWERGHETLCSQGDKRGFPKAFRGYLLARALSGTALRTVKSTLSQDVIHSQEGVDEIVKLLAKFNPTTAAHGIFSAYKGLLQIKRAPKETFKLYVNRFEAAASELRDLTGQEKNGEAEQLLAFQLLEGAQIPTPVYLQLLTNCIALGKESASKAESASEDQPLDELEKVIEVLKETHTNVLQTELQGLSDAKAKSITEAMQGSNKSIASDLEKIKDSLKVFMVAAKKDAPVQPIAINLESAIEALRGLDAISGEGASSTAAYPPPIYGAQQDDIRRIVRQTLLSQKKNSSATASSRSKQAKNGKNKKNAARRAQIARWKATSPCHDCQQKGHWAGDPECPKQKEATAAGGSMLASSTNDDAEDKGSQAVFFH